MQELCVEKMNKHVRNAKVVLDQEHFMSIIIDVVLPDNDLFLSLGYRCSEHFILESKSLETTMQDSHTQEETLNTFGENLAHEPDNLMILFNALTNNVYLPSCLHAVNETQRKSSTVLEKFIQNPLQIKLF